MLIVVLVDMLVLIVVVLLLLVIFGVSLVAVVVVVKVVIQIVVKVLLAVNSGALFSQLSVGREGGGRKGGEKERTSRVDGVGRRGVRGCSVVLLPTRLHWSD